MLPVNKPSTIGFTSADAAPFTVLEVREKLESSFRSIVSWARAAERYFLPAALIAVVSVVAVAPAAKVAESRLSCNFERAIAKRVMSTPVKAMPTIATPMIA